MALCGVDAFVKGNDVVNAELVRVPTKVLIESDVIVKESAVAPVG